MAVVARPQHIAVGASANAIVDLGRAVCALHAAVQIAADLLSAREVYLDAHTIAAQDAASVEVDQAFAALARTLEALGYVTFKTPENTNGNAS